MKFNQKKFEKAVTLLNAVSNPKRLLILCHLYEHEMTVGSLAETIELSLSPTSQHLSILREQGFVEATKNAQKVYYHLKSNEVKKLIQLLHELYCTE